MTAKNRQLSSLKREDLVDIMILIREMGSERTDISTEDFVKAIESQLLLAMSRSK
ncbi:MULTISPECIES: hypothetical protein [Bacillaceae]|uniref:hypothetical protein n=1 Tax=Bacillaceae TaxID=186817 RepID=UPI0001E897DA|nr:MULTISPECIES: hypothetical protein [Bacillaceae]